MKLNDTKDDIAKFQRLPSDTEDSYLLSLQYKAPNSVFEWPLYWLRTRFRLVKIYKSEVDGICWMSDNGAYVVTLKDGRRFRGLSTIEPFEKLLAHLNMKQESNESISYRERGIEKAIMQRHEKPVQTGAKVCHIEGDTIGILEVVIGDKGRVRYSDDPSATTKLINICDLFDAELAYRLANELQRAERE